MAMSWGFIFNGVIPERIQLIAVVTSSLLALFIIGLIRGGRLKEGYALIWFFIAVATLLFSLFPRGLQVLAGMVGIAYAPSAFLLVLVGGLYLLAIHFSLLLHRYDRRIRALAQEHAIMKEELTGSLKDTAHE